MPGPHLSVVVPTYEEAQNLPLLLDELRAALGDIDWEVIVVDDDSPDGTWRVADELGAADPRIRSLRRTEARGLSSAVMEGFSMARGEIYAVIDADLQHDPSILPEMVRRIDEGADVCVGSRNAEGGGYGDWSPARLMASRIAATVADRALQVDTGDPMSGFFAVSRRRVEEVIDEVNPRGFKILLELLARGDRPRVEDVGYVFRNRVHGETKLSGSVMAAYALAVADLRVGRYVSSTAVAYGMVGASGLVVNLSVFTLLLLAGAPNQVAVVVGVEASILTNFVLHNRFTFADRRFRGLGVLAGLAGYHLASLFGLFVQVAVFEWLTRHAPLNRLASSTFRAFLANVLAIGFATILNYLANRNLTWRLRRRAPSSQSS